MCPSDGSGLGTWYLGFGFWKFYGEMGFEFKIEQGILDPSLMCTLKKGPSFCQNKQNNNPLPLYLSFSYM